MNTFIALTPRTYARDRETERERRCGIEEEVPLGTKSGGEGVRPSDRLKLLEKEHDGTMGCARRCVGVIAGVPGFRAPLRQQQ